MASLDSLPADQRAVLQLLLRQGKSYGELADLLKSDPNALRRRAHEALAALGPDAGEIGDDSRAEISDYLLGQQSASQRAATREYLESSAPGRAWARTTAGALSPLAGDALPEIPAERAEVEQAFEALDRRAARQQDVERSSRLGGMLIFGGLGLVLAIGLIWALGIFDIDDDATTPAPRTETSQGQARYEPIETALMKPPSGSSSKATAVTVIARRAGTAELSLAIRALKLAPSSRRGKAYGVWLYTSPTTALFVGFPTRLVGRDGTLEAAFELPKNVLNYRQVLLTEEREERPQQPGTVVLRGALTVVPESARGGGQTQPG